MLPLGVTATPFGLAPTVMVAVTVLVAVLITANRVRADVGHVDVGSRWG